MRCLGIKRHVSITSSHCSHTQFVTRDTLQYLTGTRISLPGKKNHLEAFYLPNPAQGFLQPLCWHLPTEQVSVACVSPLVVYWASCGQQLWCFLIPGHFTQCVWARNICGMNQIPSPNGIPHPHHPHLAIPFPRFLGKHFCSTNCFSCFENCLTS